VRISTRWGSRPQSPGNDLRTGGQEGEQQTPSRSHDAFGAEKRCWLRAPMQEKGS